MKIFTLDFHSATRRNLPQQTSFKLRALRAGRVHAVVASWEIWGDQERQHRLTTHPEDTKDEAWGFARDMQWGQGLQLVEDFDVAQRSTRHIPPEPFIVEEGELLLLTVRFSDPCRQTLQFTLRRCPEEKGSISSEKAPLHNL